MCEYLRSDILGPVRPRKRGHRGTGRESPHDPRADRQAEAGAPVDGACAGGVPTEESLEDAFEIAIGDPGPVVVNGENRVLVLGPHRDADPSRGGVRGRPGRKSDGVVDEIEDELARDLPAVGSRQEEEECDTEVGEGKLDIPRSLHDPDDALAFGSDSRSGER